MYSVLYGNEHPDTATEFATGFDFDSRQEAEAKFNEEIADPYYRHCIRFIVLDGPDLPDLQVRENPHYQPDDGDDWRREQQMQAGMMYGTQGYNDYEGYEE